MYREPLRAALPPRRAAIRDSRGRRVADEPRDRTTQLLSAVCLAFTLSGAAVRFFHLASTLSEASFWNRWPYRIILPGVLVMSRRVATLTGDGSRHHHAHKQITGWQHAYGAAFPASVMALALCWSSTR